MVRFSWVLLLTVGLASVAQATTIDYPNFDTSAGLTLVGSANITAVPGQLQLTPNSGSLAGAGYSTTPITLGTGDTFSTQFQFQITNPGGIDPADGIAFVLAASSTGLGTAGGDLGYGGVGNSVAIEFDTYNNGICDGNSSNHVAVDIDGNITNCTGLSDQALSNVYGNASCGFLGGSPSQNPYNVPGCLSNGDIWTATITYDGTNLNATVFDPAEGSSFAAITAYPIDLSTYLGTSTAFVGFTAGTGSGFENHNILNWEFANTATLPPPPSSAVPEPASLGLLGSGLVGLIIRRRRNKRAAA